MRNLILLLSIFVSGCTTINRYSGPYTLAEKIITADKIDVAYVGKKSKVETTVGSWPEAAKFIGHSISQDGK